MEELIKTIYDTVLSLGRFVKHLGKDPFWVLLLLLLFVSFLKSVTIDVSSKHVNVVVSPAELPLSSGLCQEGKYLKRGCEAFSHLLSVSCHILLSLSSASLCFTNAPSHFHSHQHILFEYWFFFIDFWFTCPIKSLFLIHIEVYNWMDCLQSWFMTLPSTFACVLCTAASLLLYSACITAHLVSSDFYGYIPSYF